MGATGGGGTAERISTGGAGAKGASTGAGAGASTRGAGAHAASAAAANPVSTKWRLNLETAVGRALTQQVRNFKAKKSMSTGTSC